MMYIRNDINLRKVTLAENLLGSTHCKSAGGIRQRQTVQVDAAKLGVLMNDRLLEQRGRAAGNERFGLQKHNNCLRARSVIWEVGQTRGLRSQSTGLEKGTGAGDNREESIGKERGKEAQA
jgi:hypothetical protein